MKLPELTSVKTASEARLLATVWQDWNSKREISYGELVVFQDYFIDLANCFGLYDEFKENGII